MALTACGGEPPAADPANWRSGIKELKMAVSGNNDDPLLIRRRAVYRERLTAATGFPVKLYESADYNGTIQALSSGQVDLASMAGSGYANVDAQVGKLVSPILTARQAEGETGYYSIVVVRADSPYQADAGLLDAFASDYVPRSLIECAFLMAQPQFGWTLAEATALVSAVPARAAGLGDRGAIAPGLRADMVRVRAMAGVPVVRGVWVEGVRAA